LRPRTTLDHPHSPSRRRATPPDNTTAPPQLPPSPNPCELCNNLPRLLRLPLIGLHILEREPTRPLVGPGLPADTAGAAREQKTPEAHGGQEAVAGDAHDERGLAGLHVLRVGEEGAGGVEEDGYRQGWDGVGRFRV